MDSNEIIIMDLCFRIERMCRYSSLDDKEITEQAILDRNIVYYFYKNKGHDQGTVARKVRANVIRLILGEVFS